MPFTLSHPAATIPLARRGLVLSALVVGSMTPDFGYFLPLLSSGYSHTLPGTVFVCVPAGLVTLWLFHVLVKYPLLSLSPENHQARLIPLAKNFSFWPARRMILIIASLWIGALTHVVWDAFTHFKGWAVKRLPILNFSLITLPQHSLKIYKLLQHGSTIVGIVLLCYGYVTWYKRTQPQRILSSYPFLGSRRKLVFSLVIVAAILAASYGLRGIALPISFDSFRSFIFRGVVVGISALSIEMLAFSLIWHLKKALVRRRL